MDFTMREMCSSAPSRNVQPWLPATTRAKVSPTSLISLQEKENFENDKEMIWNISEIQLKIWAKGPYNYIYLRNNFLKSLPKTDNQETFWNNLAPSACS